MTTSYARVLLVTGGAILLYDGLMAVASIQFGFDYASAPGVLGSSLLYAAAGFFGARVRMRIREGVMAGAFAGLVDSTLGWLLSVLAGVGRSAIDVGPPAVVVVVVGVTLMGAVFGLVGGILGRRR